MSPLKSPRVGDNDYIAANAVQVAFTVNTAALTISADDISIAYNDAIPPALTLTYSGFVNGESAAVLATEPAASTIATGSSDVGTYPITISSGSADNYTITLVDGTLTIAKTIAEITIVGLGYTAEGESKSPTVTTTPAGLSYTMSLSQNHLNVSSLHTGIYFLVMFDESLKTLKR